MVSGKANVAISILFTAACVVTVCSLWAAGPAQPYSPSEYDFHSVVPLGTDAIELQPAKQTVYLLASAESQGFDGMRLVRQGSRDRILNADGSPVVRYPGHVTFRVTATARGPKMLDLQPFPIPAHEPLEQYLLGLRFRVLAFHGLQVKTVDPESVRMIGMPATVPYDERIYGVSFDLGNIPLADRLVLVILGPDGERLTKFHLEFE